MESFEKISIQATVKAPIEKVWNYWNDDAHIVKWCSPSPEWHTPKANNDLRIGGKFSNTMAAKDGSMSFEFEGTYTNVDKPKAIDYTIADGRQVSIRLEENGDSVLFTETFEAEKMNPIEMQRDGWQAILDSFKTYCENN